MMLKLETPFGAIYVRSTEIMAVMPERGREDRSLVYCVIFPEGVSTDMPAQLIVELIGCAEYQVGDEEE